MKIERNYLFFPDKEPIGEKDENGKYHSYKPDAKLRLRIRYGSNVVNFNVGYRVELDKWLHDSQTCKPNTTHGKKKITANEINREIQRLTDLAEKIFKAYEVAEHYPDVKSFKDAFNDEDSTASGKPQKIDMYSIYDEFTETVGMQNQWTKATYTKFSSLKTHLLAFNPKLDLNTITESDLQGFTNYLQSLGMRNTTIQKTVSFIRWFLRWAYSKGFYNGNLHLTWRPKFKGTDGNQKEVIHLTWEELIHLYEFTVPDGKQYLERVRDVFCFCCFTSLRYSDVAKLCHSDVKEKHISIVTQKTVDGLKIELNKYSRAILDKYKEFRFKGDKALPVISNVKMNVYLKELAELAGINEPQRIVYFKGNQRIEEVHPKHDLITTHCGRRTFIVNALYLGIPAEVVMRWTGHSDYKAMKPYVKIVDTLKEREMNKFNEL